MEQLNKNLTELYQSKWKHFSEKLLEITNSNDYPVKPTNPLLIKIPNEDEYKKADIKIMIFGKETNDWDRHFKNNIVLIQSFYVHFFINKTNKNTFHRLNTPFWIGVKNFLERIKQRYPDKTIYFLWNNVIKVGIKTKKGKPPRYIREIEKTYFPVLKEEINILRPDIVLFLSGNGYDKYLKAQFPSMSFEPIKNYPIDQLTEVNLENVDLAFRSYHPFFLITRRLMNDFFNAILDNIKI